MGESGISFGYWAGGWGNEGISGTGVTDRNSAEFVPTKAETEVPIFRTSHLAK